MHRKTLLAVLLVFSSGMVSSATVQHHPFSQLFPPDEDLNIGGRDVANASRIETAEIVPNQTDLLISTDTGNKNILKWDASMNQIRIRSSLLNMSGNRIVNLSTPQGPEDAVTKEYVDSKDISNTNELQDLQVNGKRLNLTQSDVNVYPPYANNSDTVDSVELADINWSHTSMEAGHVSKDDVGLGNVENIAQSGMAGNDLAWDSTNTEIDVVESDIGHDNLANLGSSSYHPQGPCTGDDYLGGDGTCYADSDTADDQNLQDVLGHGNSTGTYDIDLNGNAIETGGGTATIYDTANQQDIARFKEGGNVEVPNGDMSLGSGVVKASGGFDSTGGNIRIQSGGAYNFYATSAALRSEGEGLQLSTDTAPGGFVQLYDDDNDQVILNASVGGKVRIPNGNLEMNSNAIKNVDWANSDDGSGSSLDADLLDGVHLSNIDWSDVEMSQTDVSAENVSLADHSPGSGLSGNAYNGTTSETWTVDWSAANDIGSGGTLNDFSAADDLDSSGNIVNFDQAVDLDRDGEITDGAVGTADIATGAVTNNEVSFSTLDVSGGSVGDGSQSGLTVDSSGNLYFSGSLNFPGQVYAVNRQELNGSFVPEQDANFNIGGTSKKWNNAYLSGSLFLGGTEFTESNLDALSDGVIQNSELEHSSLTVAGNTVSLGGSTDISKSDIGLGNVRNVNLANTGGNYISYDTGNEEYNVQDNWVDESGDTMTGSMDFAIDGNDFFTLIDGSDGSNGSPYTLRFDTPRAFRLWSNQSSTVLQANHNGNIDILSGNLDMNSNAVKNVDWSNSDDGSGSGLDADQLDGTELANIAWGDVSMSTNDVSASDVGLGNVRNVDLSNTGGNYISYDTGNEEYNVADNWVDENGDTMSGVLDMNDNNIDLGNSGGTGSTNIKGHRQLYAGDETEVTSDSTSYVSKKELTMVFDSNYGRSPRYVNVVASLKNEGGATTTLEINLDGTTKTLSTTSTSWVQKKTTFDTSGLSDGRHPVDVSLKTSNGDGANTAFNDVIEFYVVE